MNTTIDTVRHAIMCAGLPPENLSEDLAISIPDNNYEDGYVYTDADGGTHHSEGQEYFDHIYASLPLGFVVAWTGNANTDGDTTSEARITLP